jgi:hypothetical protein
MHVEHIECDLHLITHLNAGAGVNPGDKVVITIDQVQEDFIPQFIKLVSQKNRNFWVIYSSNFYWSKH